MPPDDVFENVAEQQFRPGFSSSVSDKPSDGERAHTEMLKNAFYCRQVHAARCLFSSGYQAEGVYAYFRFHWSRFLLESGRQECSYF